jgi:hypothetical protein
METTINAKRFPTTSSQPFAIQIKMHKSLDDVLMVGVAKSKTYRE